MKSDEADLDERPHVYFVGNAMSFSTPILRATEAEFPELLFRRVNSFADVTRLSTDTSAKTLAVIVDETLVDDFLNSVSELRCGLPNTYFALAYRGMDTAHKVLTERLKDRSLEDVSFLPMNTQFDIWLSILRLILGGDGYISRDLWMTAAGSRSISYGGNAGSAFRQDDQEQKPCLTDREMEVLSLVAEGKQNKTIACELDLSEHTVKLHIHHVIAKLDVHNRTEAAAWFFENRRQFYALRGK